MNSKPVYLDYAAATPVADFVLAAMAPYYSDLFYNPSSAYMPAVEVRHEYEAAKQRLAISFGAKADELIMTAGATESINLAFSFSSGHIITSAVEHPAVLETIKRYDHTIVDVQPNGIVDPEVIAKAIKPTTEIISISFANSELGSLQPLRKIAAIIEAERIVRAAMGNTTPLYLHSDASQGFGLIELHVGRLGVDLLTLNAAKIYGPKQVGLLWAKPSVKLAPIVSGGGQERGLRSGTENVPGVIGFSAAAVWASSHARAEAKRISELRDVLEKQLLEHPKAQLLGSKKHRLPNFISISFEGLDAERLIFKLEKKEVLVATGSACSANKHTASHVLKAIGLEDSLINGSLRLSLGRHTTMDSIDVAAREILGAVNEEYERLAHA